MSDAVKDLRRVFGSLVLSYRTPEELRDLVGKARSRRAGTTGACAELSRTILREHTFDHRARIIVDTAERLLVRCAQ